MTDMTDMTENSNFKNTTIQIATPWGLAVGFYLKDYNLIIANSDTVSEAEEMIVWADFFPKTLVKKLFVDSLHHLVFIEAPQGVYLPKVQLSEIYTFNKLNKNKEFEFTIEYLKETLEKYSKYSGKFVVVCSNCSSFITEKNAQNFCCPDCGTKQSKEIFEGKKYIPLPAGRKIEEIIKKLNYEVPISRIAHNYWEIDEGSVLICIKYNEKEQFVHAYAVLCKLPKENEGSIYEYLLKENNYLKGLSFSVVNEEVLLSVMHISEEDLHVNSAIRLFKSLFNKADDYDDILIEMGAIPLNGEE